MDITATVITFLATCCLALTIVVIRTRKMFNSNEHALPKKSKKSKYLIGFLILFIITQFLEVFQWLLSK